MTQSLSFASSGTNNTLQEGSPKSYIDSLSDLLGHYSPVRTDTVSIKPSLPDPVGLYCPPGNNSLGSAQSGSYIPMASALASPQYPSPCHVYPSNHTSHSIIYENCLQCRKGWDGCLLPKAVPPVISSLIHLCGQKSTGGQGNFPSLQYLSASSWGLSSEIPPVEEPSLPTLTSQPPLQLSNGEATIGGKESIKSLNLTQTRHSCSLTQKNKRTHSSFVLLLKIFPEHFLPFCVCFPLTK